jgi:hypothetical protein
MKYIFTFIAYFIVNQVFGQLEKTIHQTFNVTDATNIAVQVSGDFKVENWPGDAVLVETSIKLENATNAILKHVVETGRYTIVLEDQGNGSNFLLKEQNTKRAKINTKNGLVNETIEIKIFIPSFFDISNPTLCTRKDN